jgi:hypothetical protein
MGFFDGCKFPVYAPHGDCRVFRVFQARSDDDGLLNRGVGRSVCMRKGIDPFCPNILNAWFLEGAGITRRSNIIVRASPELRLLY